MSSKNLSAKEHEIRERQKKLASRLKPDAFAENIPKPPPPPPPKASKHVVDLTKPSSATVQKRPTLKRKAVPSKASAEETPSKRPSIGTAVSSLKVDRKEKKAATGSLAKLVQHVVADDGSSLLDSTSVLPTIQADDFWKHLRDWDFCSQYAQMIGPGSKGNTAQSSRKPLPDIFLNVKQYIALWAPLCMAECRAQLVQEADSNMTAPLAVKATSGSSQLRHPNNRRNASSKAVTDFMSSFDEHDSAGYVKISAEGKGAGDSMQFMTHDICLLLTSPYKDLLQKLKRGTAVLPPGADPEDTDKLWEAAGVVGHVEVTRKTVNGLTLKVSKRKWAKLRVSKVMYLIKLGSNVTALREFTALCRIDTLPVQKFLLGQHLERDKPRKLSRHQSTQQLLDMMGGKAALGEGFQKYASNKFNTSQLAAIAASAHEYGDGGFTLIKGPPGTGKTTTLVAILNSLHIRQYNKYYDEVRRIATDTKGGRQHALEMARKSKPRLLVCAPSNAAVDNVILKIMEDGFIDGQGNRYNPSIIRVGRGQSSAVKPVALETKVESILGENLDAGRLESSVNGYRVEIQRITRDIGQLRRKLQTMKQACDWPLSRDWEIRVEDGAFDSVDRAFFVNHKDHSTTFEVPPPPEPDEQQFPVTSMPEYRSYVARVVKLVESYFSIKSHLERCTIIQGGLQHGANHMDVRMNLEAHVLHSVHIVMTTLGSAGNRTLEGTDKFEVVVVDEAAQSVEPATLSALQLGSRHAVLVGDPQQLPATIFNVSGRNTKYDRSLFQRLEEAGQPVYMLNEQYRMHPQISHFPRHIFYGGQLLDGPNVRNPDYGNPLVQTVSRSVAMFRPFTILNLDSREEKAGTSMSNPAEAQLAVYLFQQLKQFSRGLSTKSRVAVITPYAQQSRLLKQTFADALGPTYDKAVEVNTVDAFQGREANIVIFSAVRASGSRGVGFLADVRRMNVALTRAKHFLFVIARVESIVQNPYWNDLVQHARQTGAVVHVPVHRNRGSYDFGMVSSWHSEAADPRALQIASRESGLPPIKSGPSMDPRRAGGSVKIPPPPPGGPGKNGSVTKDPRMRTDHIKKPKPADPRRKISDPRSLPRDPRKDHAGEGSRPADPRKRK